MSTDIQPSRKVETEESIRPLWFTDTIIVALLTVIGYAIAFAYECGFAFAYRYPVQVIEINTLTLFTSISIVLLIYTYIIVSTSIYIISVKIFSLFRIPLLHFSLIVLFIYTIGIMLSGFTFKLLYNSWRFGLSLGNGISIAFIAFLIIIYTTRQRLPYRYTTVYNFEYMFRKPSKIFTLDISLLLSILLLVSAISFGYTGAINKKHYYTLPLSSDRIVLRIYGDSMVCVDFNRKIKSVGTTYELLPIKEQKMKYEKLGHLFMK